MIRNSSLRSKYRTYYPDNLIYVDMQVQSMVNTAVEETTLYRAPKLYAESSLDPFHLSGTSNCSFVSSV